MHTCTDKGGDFSPFHSIVYVHSPPTYSLRAPIGSHDYLSYINSLGFLFMFCSSLTNSAKLSIATVMLCKFTIVYRTIKTIVNLLYLHVAILSFASDEGPTLETLDFTSRISSTPTFSYFDLYLYWLPT